MRPITNYRPVTAYKIAKHRHSYTETDTKLEQHIQNTKYGRTHIKTH